MDEIESQGGAGLYAAMSRVMGRLERLPKNGFNQHFRYAFVEDSDVLDAVRNAMAEEGLCLFVSLVRVEQVDKKTLAHLQLTFADGKSGQGMVVPWTGEAMDTQDKGIAKAATSGVKYALLKTFLISTGDEPDTDREGPAEEKAAPKEKAPSSPPPAGQQMHKFPSLTAAMEGLMAEANRILDLRGFDGYNHVNHVKNALKQGGYAGYKPSQWQEMLDFLVKRKAEPAEGDEQDWSADPQTTAWIHDTLGPSDKDIEEALGTPLADYAGTEAEGKAALLQYITNKVAEKAKA